MKNGNRNFASVANLLILITSVFFAGLLLFPGYAFGQAGIPITTPDTRYGEGGSKVTIKDAKGRVISEEWKTKDGRTWEDTDTIYYDEIPKEPKDTDIVKKIVTRYYRYDEEGSHTRSERTQKFYRLGTEETNTLDYGEKGQLVRSTNRTPKGLKQYELNPATGKLEEVVPSASRPTSNAQPSTPPTPPATPSAPSTPSMAPEAPSSGGGTEEVMPVNFTPNEFYLGFSHNRVDLGDEREGFNGFATSFTHNFNRYLGLKIYYSLHTKSFEENGFDFSSKATIHQFLPGVQFKDNILENGPIRPFAHIMAGLAHHRFSSDFGVSSFSDSRNGFAGVVGGGIDFRVNDRVDIRTQFDYNPNRIDDEWQHNVRAGVGVVFKFGARADDND